MLMPEHDLSLYESCLEWILRKYADGDVSFAETTFMLEAIIAKQLRKRTDRHLTKQREGSILT